MAKVSKPGIGKLTLLLIAGGIVGSACSNLAGSLFPILNATKQIGLSPSSLDLQVLKITFGFSVALGPLTALGMVLGYLIYKKTA